MMRVYKTLKEIQAPVRRKQGWYKMVGSLLDAWAYWFEDTCDRTTNKK